MDDGIASEELYRGVPIHVDQPRSRIESKVKPAIDRVLSTDNEKALLSMCGDITLPPEARLLAAAMLKSIFEIAVEERRARPDFDMGVVEAVVAGLGSKQWRDSQFYCSLFDHCRMPPGGPRPDLREIPLIKS